MLYVYVVCCLLTTLPKLISQLKVVWERVAINFLLSANFECYDDDGLVWYYRNVQLHCSLNVCWNGNGFGFLCCAVLWTFLPFVCVCECVEWCESIKSCLVWKQFQSAISDDGANDGFRMKAFREHKKLKTRSFWASFVRWSNYYDYGCEELSLCNHKVLQNTKMKGEIM